MNEFANIPSGVGAAAIMFGKKIEVPQTQTPQTPTEPAKTEVKTETPTADPNIIKTPLGDIQKEIKTEKPNVDIFNFIKEKTSLEFKNNEELIEKLNKLKELEANEELIKDNVRNKKIVDAITRMPEDIKALVNAWDNGQDYTTIGKSIFTDGLDFTKSPDSIDEFKLVSHYNSDVTKDDFEEMDDKSKDLLVKSSKRLFNADAQNYKLVSQQRERQTNEYADRVVASVESTIKQLKKDFPNLTHSQVKEIETRLYQNPVADLVTNDGVYKDTAASSMAWMLYGKQTNEQIISEMQNKVYKEIDEGIKKRTSEELEILAQQRGDKVEKIADAKDGQNDLVSKIKNQMNGLLREPSSVFVNKTQR